MKNVPKCIKQKKLRLICCNFKKCPHMPESIGVQTILKSATGAKFSYFLST